MSRALLLAVVVLAVAAGLFFVWGIGRAIDHEHDCATITGQCDAP